MSATLNSRVAEARATNAGRTSPSLRTTLRPAVRSRCRSSCASARAICGSMSRELPSPCVSRSSPDIPVCRTTEHKAAETGCERGSIEGDGLNLDPASNSQCSLLAADQGSAPARLQPVDAQRSPGSPAAPPPRPRSSPPIARNHRANLRRGTDRTDMSICAIARHRPGPAITSGG